MLALTKRLPTRSCAGGRLLALADDLVDVPVWPAEMDPSSLLRALHGPQKLYTLGFHPGPRVLEVLHSEAHNRSCAEKGVELILGAPHLHLCAVREGEPGHVALLSDLLEAHDVAEESHGLLELLGTHAQPSQSCELHC